MVRAWVKLIWNSLGVATVAAAAQLGVAQALGIVRWDATYTAANSAGWNALLTWIAFIYAVSVLGGAAIGRRAMRRPTKPDTFPARIAAAVSAGVGASIGVGLALMPAVKAKPPVSVHPELLVALTAGTAIVAGIAIAIAALTVPAIAGSVRAAVAWIWLVGIGSGLAGYLTHEPYAAPRLGVIDAPSIIPVAWWSGPYLMIVVAVILGAGVAAVARWAEAPRVSIALSGFAGPLVVASAYLIAGIGHSPWQSEPYRAALIAVAAGLVASVGVAIPAPKHASGTTARATTREAPAREVPTRGALKRHDVTGYQPATPATPAQPDLSQPLLDETYEVYPAHPVNEAIPAAVAGQPGPAPQPEPAPSPAVPVLAQASPRPAATMGQPPARSYEEDYSDWLRDLGHVPGQRTAEDQRL